MKMRLQVRLRSFPPALAFLAIGLFISASAGRATIHYVPEQHPTIQQGINAAGWGDTVLVNTGTYTENITLGNAEVDIVVASYYLVTGNESYITATQIQSAAVGLPVVLIMGGQSTDTRLCGFTITGGMGELGSGIRCIGSSPTIDHNHILGNCTEQSGGGIYVESGGPNIAHNRIAEN